MTSLTDLGELTEQVDIGGGKKVDIGPIPARGLLHLIAKYPEVQMLLQKRFDQLKPETLMQIGPQAIADLIGMGLLAAKFGDESPSDAEWKAALKKEAAAAMKQGFPNQLKLVVAIFRRTFPDGTGPFVAELNNLEGIFKQEVSGLSNLPPDSQDMVQASKSFGQLSAALQMDGPKLARGKPPLVN